MPHLCRCVRAAFISRPRAALGLPAPPLFRGDGVFVTGKIGTPWAFARPVSLLSPPFRLGVAAAGADSPLSEEPLPISQARQPDCVMGMPTPACPAWAETVVHVRSSPGTVTSERADTRFLSFPPRRGVRGARSRGREAVAETRRS